MVSQIAEPKKIVQTTKKKKKLQQIFMSHALMRKWQHCIAQLALEQYGIFSWKFILFS